MDNVLDGSRITSFRLNMTGHEFIGRLWHFASHRKGADVKNAQFALMTALSDSIEDDGHRVCNPGKIQRLLIAVLQGQLPGVNIDGLDEAQLLGALPEAGAAGGGGGLAPVALISPAIIFAQFSALDHIKALILTFFETPIPSNAEAIRGAAARYLDENQTVDRVAFNKNVEELLKSVLMED